MVAVKGPLAPLRAFEVCLCLASGGRAVYLRGGPSDVPGVFATLRYLEGAGSRFRLHVGRSARERGQARSREARVDPTERAVSDQDIVDDPHQRIADLIEIFGIDMVAVVA